MRFFDRWKKRRAAQNDDMVIKVYHAVCEKCDDGAFMEKLNAVERVLYITQKLETEVNGGGFSQFFYNTAGRFWDRLVPAFMVIGAVRTANICASALSALGGHPLPTVSEECAARLDRRENEEVEAALDECDKAFYEYEDDLTARNAAYIRKHKRFFDRL